MQEEKINNSFTVLFFFLLHNGMIPHAAAYADTGNGYSLL